MRVVFGPWVGEFGWELFCWQGYCRASSRQIKAKGDTVVVVGAHRNRYLYKDFCDEFIPLPVELDIDSASMWINNKERSWTNKFVKTEVLKENDIYIDPVKIWQNTRIQNKPFEPQRKAPLDEVEKKDKWLITALQPQEFIKFGRDLESGSLDILFHVRDRKAGAAFRNWPIESAQAVADHFSGLKMGCVGLSETSKLIPGVLDQRDIPAGSLSRLMARSKVVVGPMSGPCHLASLCGTNQATWVTKPQHLVRGEEYWNPFKTKVFGLSSDFSVWRNRTPWTPEVSEIIGLIENALSIQNTEGVSNPAV